jgi:hypothetical protein
VARVSCLVSRAYCRYDSQPGEVVAFDADDAEVGYDAIGGGGESSSGYMDVPAGGRFRFACRSKFCRVFRKTFTSTHPHHPSLQRTRCLVVGALGKHTGDLCRFAPRMSSAAVRIIFDTDFYVVGVDTMIRRRARPVDRVHGHGRRGRRRWHGWI